MIREISKILSQFKNCFSRTAPFNWFAIIIMGFFVRLDHHGVSSMVRWLNLEPSKYTSLLLFFRTSSWNLKKIQEKWWQIVQLAYTQLYLSREICQLIPNPWERYLPKFKQPVDEGMAAIVSPSLAQRYFPKILEQIGTPAKDVRKVKPGTGREEGDKQEKRTVNPIIFKTQKTKSKELKKDPDKIQAFEKQQNSSKPQKIEDLIGTLKSWLSEIEISKKLTYDEQPKLKEGYNPIKDEGEGKGFHEKKEKNNKINKGGSYKRIIKNST